MFHSAQRPDARAPAHDPARRGAMGALRRAFTILELMIVVTLLVAMTGLVMPSVLNRLGDSLAASSLQQIEATASECRSRAQQEGRAIRLIAKVRRAGTVGLYIERIGETETISVDDTVSDGFGAEASIGLQDSFGGFAASPVYVLPAGFSFSRTLPLVDDGFFRDPSVADDDSVGGGAPGENAMTDSFMVDPGARALTLAVYLPDGTAIVERPLFLRTGDETYAIEINRWTGGVVSTRVRLDDEDGIGSGGSGGDGFGDDDFGESGFGRGGSGDGADRFGSDGRRGGGP